MQSHSFYKGVRFQYQHKWWQLDMNKTTLKSHINHSQIAVLGQLCQFYICLFVCFLIAMEQIPIFLNNSGEFVLSSHVVWNLCTQRLWDHACTETHSPHQSSGSWHLLWKCTSCLSHTRGSTCSLFSSSFLLFCFSLVFPELVLEVNSNTLQLYIIWHSIYKHLCAFIYIYIYLLKQSYKYKYLCVWLLASRKFC